MMLMLQHYTFKVEYHQGSTLLITDTLSCAPLPTSSQKPVHKNQSTTRWFTESNLRLTLLICQAFQDATFQDIRATVVTDPELIKVQALIESGWPTCKTYVPQLARLYWPVRDELKVHNGLLFKQDRVIIPSSVCQDILNKLHATYRGPEFTLCHARNCVFWPGIASQIINMCKACLTCAQHA